MKPDILDLTNFLADYADLMISVGSHNERVRRCIRRIAHAYGFDVSIFVLLKNVTISVTDLDDYTNRRTYIKETCAHAINLAIVSDLGSLSWLVHDEKIELKKAICIFNKIKETKNTKFGPNLLFMSVAFGAFCHLFGGDVGSVGFVVLSTLIGVIIKHLLEKRKFDIRIIYLVCSFVSSFVAYGAFALGISTTPAEALSSSILYLFPGILVLNSIFDILDRNVLIGLSRGVNACILIICMAIGVYITLSIVKVGLL
ncbi:threonine/serine ThrE exporter family protein [Campylobacter geochelonis]|uniref:Phosphoglycerate kinase n=1 Tax=Campylobacter geochelonis TaxID=1780362 RepID=A0A128EF71_9BACT|nr:threonine/serine exporter family protein [Campylobacter geochelonis]QKF71766.1 putative threonine/serine exporter, ThrE family (DUF1212 domain) [Campylobacter geochelonis]CZE47559.1 phosphoglycerate kinase [Campylobacter geochelonis]CZE51184.1 phosphoglycerate kinase [Campylobacter geochelonis]